MPLALELSGISKSFDGHKVLQEAAFSAEAGEVHALLGENGAGKSTLMNVAAGLYLPDIGRIRVDGHDVVVPSPKAARALGIGMVHQHYKLVRSFSAVENILMSRQSRRFARDKIEIADAIRRRCDDLGFRVDVGKPVGLLSVAEQQRVEIVKVLIDGATILILDEPTAVLTDKEAAGLLEVMRQLARQGSAVVLVTHKLREVKSHADRVTVMRGGHTVATADPASLSVAELTTMIVGGSVVAAARRATARGTPVLSARGLAGARSDGLRVLESATFDVRAGEIYGIAGVGGNGQSELTEILTGTSSPLSGKVDVAGVGDVANRSVSDRRDAGLVSIPADRYVYGLAGDLSVGENYAVTGVRSGRFGNWLKVDRRAIRDQTRKAVAAFDVQGVRDVRQRAGLLSGGNAQKLVIAREFAIDPRIVLAHSPTRGLDVRAAAAVQNRLRQARDGGAAVLLISEDLDEVLALADRIGVMNRGRIVAEFDAPADRRAIGEAMVHHA